MAIDKTLLRVSEAAESLGVSRSYLYGAIQRGEVPVIRLGGRVARIPQAWLLRRIEEEVSEWERARGKADGR